MSEEETEVNRSLSNLSIKSDIKDDPTEDQKDTSQDLSLSDTIQKPTSKHTSSNIDCDQLIHDQEENNLSLAEIAEMIQNNQPIPGVINLDVKVTNENPTPSTMVRKLKPWESIK